MAKQISIQIAITPDAKAAVDGVMKWSKLKQITVLSQIYEWFGQLPQAAQQAILWPPKSGEEIEAAAVALNYLFSLRSEMSTGPGEVPTLFEHWQKMLEENRPDKSGGKARGASKKQPPPQSQLG